MLKFICDNLSKYAYICFIRIRNIKNLSLYQYNNKNMILKSCMEEGRSCTNCFIELYVPCTYSA